MNQIRRPRRAPSGGYARGDETRQRIIEAALTLFGERGYDKASTRDIAAAAEVNAPALQYYFENKEGVYLACAQFMVDDIRARFAESTAHADTKLSERAPVSELIDAYLAIEANMLDMALSPTHLARARLFSREMAGEGPKTLTSLIDRELKEPMRQRLFDLLSRVMGTRAGDTVTRIRMLTLRGQSMAFHYPPGACLQMLNWDEMTPRRAKLIKQNVASQTRILLEHWAREAGLL